MSITGYINFRKLNSTQYLTFFKKKKLSNASNNITRLKYDLSLQYKFRKLLFTKNWMAGRSSKGSIIVKSKGSSKKIKEVIVNYNFRQRSLFFIGGLNCINFKDTKITNILFTSEGFITYIPAVESSYFFLLCCCQSIFYKRSPLYRDLCFLKPSISILIRPFLLFQQYKNTPISFLELKLAVGSQYTRSLGSKSKLLKLDTRTGYGLVVLPSLLKKVFSIFALASAGAANLCVLKKSLKSTKFGDKKKRGFKPKVRGVAKNPVDHPHGGRTKAIKYQRTPWGKTTKFK